MLKSEEGIGEHRFESTKNDEKYSGTISNTNSGKGSATNGLGSYSTIDDISIGETTKGIEVGDTTYDITTRKITAGTKPWS
jgi:hypothetical protein